MKLFGWISGSKPQDDRTTALTAWRRTWAGVLDSDGSAAPLREQLDALTAPDLDTEVELEMLDALDQLREAQRAAAAGALAIVETHHRVIGADRCHFTAPASLPSDQHQANGRLLLTSARAVFVGGGRTSAAPWHAVHEIVRVERDVLLLRGDRSPAAHYRFNTYADAVLCAFLAGRLRRAR
ncbi:MAG: hypothetical protein M3541_04305 [Acidobacteriota bacterium]|nr:hypothetical protein [Acidobacteriota bacterium]MDQ3417990.1 hypothetical protein [Acidobacteriota bacterium]